MSTPQNSPLGTTERPSRTGTPCGRRRTDGTPCPTVAVVPVITDATAARIEKFYGPRPCPEHATPNDRALAEVITKVWADAFTYGRAVGGHDAAPAQATASRRPQPVTQAEPGQARERDVRSRQLVVVQTDDQHAYTYHWIDHTGVGDLMVGDVVLLPANAVRTDLHEGTVITIGSSYAGQTRGVLKLVRRGSLAPQ